MFTKFNKGFRVYLMPVVVFSVIILALSIFSGCKKSSVSTMESVFLDITQSQWNLSYANSSGTVEVFLVGEGIENILPDSIVMKGDNPSAPSLKPSSVDFQGNRVCAEFLKNQVLTLLLNPTPGSTHTVIVVFRMSNNSEPQEVTSEVTISTLELTLEIDPAEWNLNFTNSSGTVEAFIRGEGIDKIDLTSIEMNGDEPSAASLLATSATLQGDHIHARFPKNQVIDLLLDPAKGTTHTIIVSFLEIDGSERMELSAEITIEDGDIDPTELTLEIDPAEWDLNFTNSSGTVEAFISGEGIDKIDLTSIEMMGDNTSAEPLSATSASLNGDHIHARFPKNQVIDLLLDPAEGTTHTIIVSFLEIDGSERMELSAEITIIGEIDPTELTLEIDPDEWNLNYTKSSGTVEAFIRGEGIDKIDLDTIEMMGDNLSAEPLSATSASLNGYHIHARFPKNQVIDLLLNPAEGTTHTIIISFIQIDGSERLELSAEITIIEDEDDDDVDPTTLTLQLAPPNWNLNFYKNSGTVEAFIRGKGIEKIDLNSIEMAGDNPSAAPLPANSASLQGNHVKAKFPKNQVLDLLLNPASGTTHTVTVSFAGKQGSKRYEVSTVVTITGNPN